MANIALLSMPKPHRDMAGEMVPNVAQLTVSRKTLYAASEVERRGAGGRCPAGMAELNQRLPPAPGPLSLTPDGSMLVANCIVAPPCHR